MDEFDVVLSIVSWSAFELWLARRSDAEISNSSSTLASFMSWFFGSEAEEDD